MGVASCQAALGDVVCWVGGTKTALVVRPTGSHESAEYGYAQNVQLQVIGTAMVAEDIADSMIDHSLRLNIQGERGEVRCEYGVRPPGKVPLMLDARTLFIILLENHD
ncbi:hypothetical protein BDP55DRAFT_633904 [Colletotrichum godetiae]|uniref:Uncharacterized protein n=1 Tax=Colletotrichum godetiae TaxID=1209918 RepID=A0AAJ0AGT4_9PEZI|nr:uncharacterized protein BDP55DRAFT_633904 [Colletotrichum godetiae]KAK1673632.1 hypothetical protein BDP55DRAFT_633904 [Colletotrichum godetiae]